MSKHDNNNQSNDARSSQGETAGANQAFADSIQSECYSSYPPTTTTLNTTVTTININSNLEDIPVPRVVTTNLVCTTKPDIFNKPQDFIDPVSGVILQQPLLENFIGPDAVTHNMRIYGDAGSRFIFFLKDITNNKKWDWYVHSGNSYFPNDPQWRVNTIDTSFKNPFAYPPAGAPGGPQNYIPVDFPAVSVNTTYHAYFTSACSACAYLDHLPTQANPWVINQLIDIDLTTNFKTETIGSITFTKGIDDTYAAPAGAILPTAGNNGVWDVDIDIEMSGHGEEIIKYNLDRRDAFGSGLHNKVVTVDNIEPPNTGSLPEILAIDCVTSITSTKTAKIIGTITLGNVGLVSQSLIFPITEFFVAESP